MEGDREKERERVSRETDITKVHYNKTDRDIRERRRREGGEEGKEKKKRSRGRRQKKKERKGKV